MNILDNHISLLAQYLLFFKAKERFTRGKPDEKANP